MLVALVEMFMSGKISLTQSPARPTRREILRAHPISQSLVKEQGNGYEQQSRISDVKCHPVVGLRDSTMLGERCRS